MPARFQTASISIITLKTVNMTNTSKVQNFQHVNLELDPNKLLFAPDNDGVIQYEIWKDLPKYEGLYQVSNFSRVKSLKRKVRGGVSFRLVRERILKQSLSCGYLRVRIFKNNKVKSILSHQLVCIAFKGHIPNGHITVVDHKDNVKTNNFEWNLQLMSSRENISKSVCKSKGVSVGVNWCKRDKKWISRIAIKYNRICLGRFDSKEEANRAYNDYCVKNRIKNKYALR